MEKKQTSTAPPPPTIKLWNNDKQDYDFLDSASGLKNLEDAASPLSFKPGDKYYFKYPDGQVGMAEDAKSLSEALKAGGQEVDRRTALLRQEARGALGTAMAFGSSAASSASFGLSDVAARAVDELSGNKFNLTERIRASQEASPIASTLGSVAGYVAPGSLAKAAGTAAIKGVERVAGKQLAGLAEKGALGSIASSGIKMGASGALEGAAQGVGQTISQQALQSTPQGVTESLVSNVGLGVLFGGGAGSIIGGGAKALAPVVGGAGKGFTTVTSKLKGMDADEVAAGREIFEPGSEALKVLRSPQKFEEQVANSTQKLMNDIETSGKQASSKLNKLIEDTASDPIKGNQAKTVVLEHMDALSKDPSLSPKVKTVLGDIQRKLTPMTDTELRAIETTLGSLEVKLSQNLSAAERESIQSQAEALKRRLTLDSPENALQSLREIRRDVSEAQRDFQKAYTMTGDREANLGLKQLDSLNSVLKKTVWDEQVFGPQAGLLAELDEAIASRYSAFNALKETGVVKKDAQGFVLKRNSIKALLRDEKNGSLIEDLLAAEHKVQSVGSKLTGEAIDQTTSDLPKLIQARQTVRSLFDNELMTGRSLWAGGLGATAGGAIAGAPGAAVGAFIAHALENPGTVTKFLANRYSDALKVGKLADKDTSWGVLQSVAATLNQQTQSQTYTQRLDQESRDSALKTGQVINRATQSLLKEPAKTTLSPSKQFTVNDYKKTLEVLSTPQSFSDVNDPILRASLETQRQLIESYVVSKAPPKREDSLGFQKEPTKQQLLVFGRTVEAATNPIKVIEDIGKGYVSREGLETLQAVYPALYEALKEEIKGTIKDEPSLKNKSIIAQIIGTQNRSQRVAMSLTGWSQAQALEEQDAQSGGLMQGSSRTMGQDSKLVGLGSMGATDKPRRGAFA